MSLDAKGLSNRWAATVTTGVPPRRWLIERRIRREVKI
jgi:hypothetical protein